MSSTISTEDITLTMSTEDIISVIPHRYPMLMIDRIEDIVLGESAVGIKNITINEPFFQGHFPSKPVMPGVLIVEAMAQTAGALVMKTLGKTYIDHLVYFMSIDSARFRSKVLPGDILRLCVQRKQHRGNVWVFEGKAYVGKTLAAESTYRAMIAPINTE